MATPWNQVTVSKKVGLGLPLPACPPDKSADIPDTIRAPPQMAAATIGTAVVWNVLPLPTVDWMQAISEPSFSNSSFAVPSRSGTLKAIAGIWLAYWLGICCDPCAEKVP